MIFFHPIIDSTMTHTIIPTTVTASITLIKHLDSSHNTSFNTIVPRYNKNKSAIINTIFRQTLERVSMLFPKENFLLLATASLKFFNVLNSSRFPTTSANNNVSTDTIMPIKAN